MSKTTRDLIASLYRRPHELAALTSRGVVLRRRGLFVGLTLLLIVPMVIALGKNLVDWERVAASVELPRTQWHAMYRASSSPCTTPASEPDCPANPSNSAIESSPDTVENRILHRDRTDARPGQEYWIGTTISAEQAARAYAEEANQLLLGGLRGSHRVWVNGHMLLTGEWLDAEPVVLQIPLEWLKNEAPLKVAIRLKRTVVIGDAPDRLEDSPLLGLAPRSQVTAWKRYQDFWFTSRPFALVMLNLLLALTFFAVWYVAPEKTEYFYISLMSIAYGLYQLRYLDLYYIPMDREMINKIGLSANVMVPFTGILAGFSFARMRNAILTATLGTCAVLAIGFPLFSGDSFSMLRIGTLFQIYMTEVGLVVGAIPCFLQAHYLLASGGNKTRLAQRIRRLVFFGSGLIALAVVNHFVLAPGVPSITQLLIGRSGPFFLLISLGLVALSEYRAEHALALSMPVSKFHRLDPLPASVRGALLNVDLKGSEKISRQSAKLGSAGDLMEICLSHMWMAVSKNGGHVLQTEGDALRALFPEGDVKEPARAAIVATETMRQSLQQLEQRFVAQGMSAVPEDGLHFRASIVEGEIRPIWQAYGGTRLAGWSEAGGTNAFVESSRLLEMERQVGEGGAAASVVVVPTPLGERLQEAALPGRWLFDRHTMEGKHGLAYEVAAYRVAESGPR